MKQSPTPRAARRFAAVIGVSLSSAVWSQTYEFVIDPQQSGLAANLGLDVGTSGTLIGDWHPETNAAGTRTSAGLFGHFGASENSEVGVDLGLSLAGDLETPAAGSFRLGVDVVAGRVTLEAFHADLIAGGPVGLPAIVSVAPQSFRTRGPDSGYPGTELQLPAGEVELRGMSLVRRGEAATGTLSEVEPGRYAFTVVAPAELHASFALNGWPVELSADGITLTVSGEITVAGRTATVESVYRIDHAEWDEPGVALPQFSMDVPTALPAGRAARVLMDLSLDELGTSLVGELTLHADGVATGCDADFNADGAINVLDFVAFLRLWSVRSGAADFNADKAVNSADVVDYLGAWASGC